MFITARVQLLLYLTVLSLKRPVISFQRTMKALFTVFFLFFYSAPVCAGVCVRLYARACVCVCVHLLSVRRRSTVVLCIIILICTPLISIMRPRPSRRLLSSGVKRVQTRICVFFMHIIQTQVSATFHQFPSNNEKKQQKATVFDLKGSGQMSEVSASWSSVAD